MHTVHPAEWLFHQSWSHFNHLAGELSAIMLPHSTVDCLPCCQMYHRHLQQSTASPTSHGSLKHRRPTRNARPHRGLCCRLIVRYWLARTGQITLTISDNSHSACMESRLAGSSHAARNPSSGCSRMLRDAPGMPCPLHLTFWVLK
jgi:hypothetical protein